jgi:hypothetical protein
MLSTHNKQGAELASVLLSPFVLPQVCLPMSAGKAAQRQSHPSYLLCLATAATPVQLVLLLHTAHLYEVVAQEPHRVGHLALPPQRVVQAQSRLQLSQLLQLGCHRGWHCCWCWRCWW